MKPFLDEHFLLKSNTAQLLYQEYASKMPLIDYHCHLSPQQIAENIHFKNITDAWLSGDHYKWRAMRSNGVDESYCTGTQSDEAKFYKWAATVPYTMRNPLYHWTHLELQRYFNVHTILNSNSAAEIYSTTSAMLQESDYSTQGLIKKMNVRVICTTDDPIDSLQYHQQIKDAGFEVKVYPAFRPDKAMEVNNAAQFVAYVKKVEAVTNSNITTLDDYLNALKKRHDFFATMGCTVSDHGLEEIYAEDFTQAEVNAIFVKVNSGNTLALTEQRKFKSFILIQFAEWDCEKGWIQQYHLGALRNNNARMMQALGADTGWDSIGDFSQAAALAKFLNKLDQNNRLTKTIVYNLNPADNEVMATMIGNFNDGAVAGKVQFGSAWWFLDQKDGMTKQINALSNMGLISRFIGMLTDSRSFLSYPRHEYFRRLLCNIFGTEIEEGELPNDIPWIGQLIQDICFNNANEYFGWKAPL
jgi:glucuronate isomerase